MNDAEQYTETNDSSFSVSEVDCIPLQHDKSCSSRVLRTEAERKRKRLTYPPTSNV